MSCGVVRRCGWDPALLWLWCRQVAIAPTPPLAWDPSYAVGAALKSKKKKKKKKIPAGDTNNGNIQGVEGAGREGSGAWAGGGAIRCEE